jgi:hypothetical protein
MGEGLKRIPTGLILPVVAGPLLWVALGGRLVALNSLGKYAQKQALDAVFRRTQSPAAGTVYLAIGTSATVPTDDADTVAAASWTEYAATGYARQAAAVGAPTDATPSVISNSGTITWGPFTAGTGAICRYFLWSDSATSGAGNLIAVGQLTTDRTPATGDSLQGAAAAFTNSLN